jgi:fumarate reductase subunit D
MKHIQSNLKRIKRRIMLRVWYSYLISLVNNPVAWAGMVFGASGTLFVQIVSVPNILLNLLNVRLGAVPQYLWQVLVKTVVNGEFLKLVTLVLIIFSILYLHALLRHSSFSNRLIQSV